LLIKYLKNDNSTIRADAAKTLGEIKDTRAVEPLIQALKDNDSGVQLAAQEALAKLRWQQGSAQDRKSDRVPKDLSIFYGFGACHAEWGRTEVSIDANGQGLYEEGSGSLRREGGQKFENEIFRKTFVLNETELLGLLDGIEKSGFYYLNDSYYNHEVQDGGCEGIQITRNNTTKSVSVSNMAAPQAYKRTAKIIIEIAENKTGPKTTGQQGDNTKP
jgi:hypothetical protein